jgi:ABC-2 type transport system permease protein
MIRFLRQCCAIGRRDLALQRSYGLSALIGVVASALGLASYHFIGRLVGAEHAAELAGGTYFAFVWTGIMAQLVIAATLGSLGSALARESAEGTLEPELAAGASPIALVVGATCAPALLALVQVTMHAAVGALLFDLELGRGRPGPMAAAMCATVVACAPIGFLGATVWLLIRRAGLVTTAALFAFGVVGGVYFPVTLLPAPLATLAQWVPLTVGLDASRAALLEGAGWSPAPSDAARSRWSERSKSPSQTRDSHPGESQPAIPPTVQAPPSAVAALSRPRASRGNHAENLPDPHPAVVSPARVASRQPECATPPHQTVEHESGTRG